MDFAHSPRSLALQARLRQFMADLVLLQIAASPAQVTRWLDPLLAGTIRSCFAMSEPDTAPEHARHSMLLVPLDTPGLTVERNIPVMDHQSLDGHCELVFREARVSAVDLPLGAPGLRFAGTLQPAGSRPGWRVTFLSGDKKVTKEAPAKLSVRHLALVEARALRLACPARTSCP